MDECIENKKVKDNDKLYEASKDRPRSPFVYNICNYYYWTLLLLNRDINQ